MKKYILCFALFWIGQIYLDFCIAQSLSNLPKVIPPSPESSSFTIYGDYPVAFNTGVPDIQIPLYSIDYGDIHIPITLKYHIGSAKPNLFGVELSNVGFGWIVEAGGMISRTIYNRQDEMGKISSSILSDELNESDSASYEMLQQLSLNQLDSEYDIFNYSFLSNTGQFVIEKLSENSYNVHTFPYKPLKFDIKTNLYSGNNHLISSIRITDDRGFKYSFNDVEYENVNTGWFLTKLVSPMMRQVNFKYANKIVSTVNQYYKSYISVNDYFLGENIEGGLPNQPDISAPYSRPVIYSSYTKTIEEISSDLFKVTFELNQNKSLIKHIKVCDENGQLLRRITFYQSYFSGQSQYVKLDSVQVQDHYNHKVQTYIFHYNSISILNSQNVDYWGWYNGISYYQTSYLPQMSIQYQFSNSYWQADHTETRIIGRNDRCVDTSKILAQTLKRIVYPTGGSTVFKFEPHQYQGSASCNDKTYGGGLRIKSIINYDRQNVAFQRTFIYPLGNVRFDRFSPDLSVHYSYNVQETPWGFEQLPKISTVRNRVFSEDLNGEILDYHIFYDTVTEYAGTEIENTGKNVYTYLYSNSNEYEAYSALHDRLVFAWKYKDWCNGVLNKTDIFRNVSDHYVKVKEIINNYNYSYFTPLHSLKVYRLSDYPSSINLFGNVYTGERLVKLAILYTYSLDLPPIFGKYDYYIQTGTFNLTSTTETLYQPEPVSTSVKYYFEKGYDKFVTKVVSDENSFWQKTKRFYYPYDSISVPIYSIMVDSNRLNYNIGVFEEKNESIQKTISEYKYWGNGIYNVESVKQSFNNLPFESLINCLEYDEYGNLKAVIERNGLQVIYLWGYHKLYPIAEIINSNYSAVNSLNPDISKLEIGNKYEQQRLRDALPNASITFYTFRPLVGMSSRTDPNGIKTIYEYDPFGRLKLIKDDDGRILKSYEYHYLQ